MISSRYLAACQIPFPAKIGQYNEAPGGVEFVVFKDQCPGPVEIGDCNVFHAGTRIMVGPGGFKLGDYNVIHNHCTFGGPGPLVIGHNGWFGQETWLDSTGGLFLGNGVRIGLRSHVWSHIASGEQIEGWLCAYRPTHLEDDVWLVGDDVHVASGVTMGERSAAMAHSVVTRDTLPDRVYMGTPAREVSFRLRRDVPLGEKRRMMVGWVQEFCDTSDSLHYVTEEKIEIIRGMDRIVVNTMGAIDYCPSDTSYFSLETKRYCKNLSQLERDFVCFLYGNKARFLPVEGLK